MRAIILTLAGALALAGCTTAPPTQVKLTLVEIPDDLKACAARRVPAPGGAGPLTDRELYRLISRLKASGDAKDACIARLIALYEAQSAALTAAQE